MAHTSYPVASVTDIPALVHSFAGELGFSVTLENGGATVRHPSYAGAKTFSVGTLVDGTGRTVRERVTVELDVPGVNIATAESPKMNVDGGSTDASIVVYKPTLLHLFGELQGGLSDAGGSFIAGVIEYGYNLYRHFYLGYVEKITEFGGGEVITGSSQGHSSLGTSSYNWTDLGSGACRLPFSAVNGNTDLNGGMHVDHVAANQPGYSFNTGVANLATTFAGSISSANGNSVVLGGYRDSVNSGYLVAAQSPYSNAQILVPINLYLGKRLGSQQSVFPIGAPAGVRLVSVENLEPGAEIQIGASVWRVFPLFAKDSDPILHNAFSAGNNYRYATKNTSHFVGQAYRVRE